MAFMLEAALRLAQGLTEARAGVRFAFWGAEGRGLIGSRHHLGSLQRLGSRPRARGPSRKSGEEVLTVLTIPEDGLG